MTFAVSPPILALAMANSGPRPVLEFLSVIGAVIIAPVQLSVTGIPSVNEEIAKVLPDTRVIIDLGKAALVGLLGGVQGLATVGAVSAATASADQGAASVTPDGVTIIALLVGAPLLSIIASRVPALMAARQNPAEVLNAAGLAQRRSCLHRSIETHRVST